jgi:ectoine hydroxylase-related dioxygenase (phytanoyl-CoA dioxygenase family)
MLDFSSKESIFKDPKQTKFFNENGYVIVPFLSERQIQELLALYQKFYPDGVEGFFTTTFANNVEHREQVNSSIRSICLERTNELLENYQTFFSSFIVKAPGPKSELIMHQDMTLLDERMYTGTNIWCPLVDLTDQNGAIEVLPKSHRFFKTFRGSSIPDIYDNVVPEVKEIMMSCKLKAGEAIIFDQSIIHYSPPNLSDRERPVINTFVAHKDAQIKICYWDKESGKNEIEIFEQENDFLEKFENFGHNIFSRPSIGKSLGFFQYDFPKLTVEMLEAEYDAVFERKKMPEKKSWLKRMLTKQGR